MDDNERQALAELRAEKLAEEPDSDPGALQKFVPVLLLVLAVVALIAVKWATSDSCERAELRIKVVATFVGSSMKTPEPVCKPWGEDCRCTWMASNRCDRSVSSDASSVDVLPGGLHCDGGPGNF